MVQPDADVRRPGVGSCHFATTHWSVVLAAGDRSCPEASVALERLCRAYWYPLYAYTRRRGHSPEDAEDVTQDFLTHLLSKEYLGLADPERGRFRTFLVTALKNFLANRWKREARLKRGGQQPVLSIDVQGAEQRYGQEPADLSTPELIYEKRWAATVLERVLGRIADEYTRDGKTALLEHLKAALWGEQGRPTYAILAERLGMSETAIKVAMFRLRQRYRELLRAELAQTVARTEEVDEEIAHFLAVLSQ